MKQRWLITAFVLAALGWLGYYIAMHTEWHEITIPMPLRGEAASNPHYALQTFMRKLDVDVHAEQSLLSMPSTNVVILLNSWHWDLIKSRGDKLKTWVQAGGRLIVDNTLVATEKDFAEWSGVSHHYPIVKINSKKSSASDSDDSDKDEDADDVDNNDDKTPCSHLTVSKDGATLLYRSTYTLCPLSRYGWLESKSKPLWSLRDKLGLQALRVAVGKGTVTVFNTRPLGNRQIKAADNAAVWVALAQLHHHDELWFVTESEHASILNLTWQYGAPAVIVLAVFIIAALWRNAVRFGPQAAPTETARRSLAELIRGSGWFLERQGDAQLLDTAISRALREAAAKHIRGYNNLSPAKQAAALAQVAGFHIDQLQSALQTVAPRSDSSRYSNRERRRAIALLEMARRRLLEHSRLPEHKSFTQSSHPEVEHGT